MVDLDFVATGNGEFAGGVVANMNGERLYPAEVKEISEYYRVETREGCFASYCVPFNSVHYEKGGILFVDDPKFEKRANKKIERLVLGGK